jgi:hypothetical protein
MRQAADGNGRDLGKIARTEDLDLVQPADGSGALTEQGVVDAHLCCRTSCERHIPLFLQRPAAPPTRSKFELALADPMHEFQARQGQGRRPVGLEPEHGLASVLDRPVVLLDDVVQVASGRRGRPFPVPGR